jgi:hypothetical protein
MRIPLFLAAGVLLLASYAPAATVIVHPVPIDAVLYNPGIGVELWHRATWGTKPESYPEVTLTYYRWYWHEIEPERGKIRWDLIDAAFKDAATNGDRLGFRLMTVGGESTGRYQGRTGAMAVPSWWAEKVGGFWYGEAEQGGVFWPNYNSPLFLAEISRIMTAFGERYANHPGLNHLDTSFFGCWGEQNDACVEGRVAPEHMWSAETYRKAIDIQFEAFPQTPIMQLGHSDPTVHDYPMLVRKTGWRVDCFGDYNYFSENWSHMGDLYPKILARYGEAWKSGMVSLEICGSIKNWVDRGFDFDRIMDDALAYHATSMNLKAGNIPPEWMPKLLDTIKYMGYRLRVAKAESPATIGVTDPWMLRLEMVNEGVAPPYHQYPIGIKLESTTGQNWLHTITEVDVRQWLPGSHAVELTVPPPELPDGSYMLSVALLDRHANMPGIQLANEGREGESFYYSLATVQVSR